MADDVRVLTLREEAHWDSKWKGGNTTRGAHRRGGKGPQKGAGRPKLYPGVLTYTTTIKLSEPELMHAMWAGRGKIARGMRIALEFYSKHHPVPGSPVLDRYAMADRIDALKKAGRIEQLLAMAEGRDPYEVEERTPTTPAPELMDTSWISYARICDSCGVSFVGSDPRFCPVCHAKAHAGSPLGESP